MFGRAVCLVTVALALTLAGATQAGAMTWHPAKRGGLDCNGWSLVQKPVKASLPCTEVAANSVYGFEDNEHYVGHDEADIGWFSRAPGSGSNQRYVVRLPRDPASTPSGSVHGPVWDFQLEATRWFGLTLCDNQSYPEGTKVCKRDSDTNIQNVPNAHHAGAAFMELQMYPPGDPPFVTALSCDLKHWCAALTIDSLQASFGALHGSMPPGAVSNPNCTEPVNFAFLTKSGKPIGPPGPDQMTIGTFTPTPDVLLMNRGDKLVVSIHDSPAGLVTKIRDDTTHQTGRMVASVANGFRHILWDPVNFTCKGAPYAFHPMYSSARPPLPNGQPTAWTTWAAHTDNVAISGELGHFQRPDGDTDDTECSPGPLIPGCLSFTTLDEDFDGYSYHADWPNGSSRFPTPMLMSSPRSLARDGSRYLRYPIVRFETDLPRIEESDQGPHHCNHHTGQRCVNPPPGAKFYPWYHLVSTHVSDRARAEGIPGPGLGRCAWTLSNDLPDQISNFGGEKAAWGPLERTNYGFDKRIHNFARALENPC